MNPRIEAATRAISGGVILRADVEDATRMLTAADAVMFSDEATERVAEMMACHALSNFPDHRDYWLDHARAVIAALRDAPHATGEGK